MKKVLLVAAAGFLAINAIQLANAADMGPPPIVAKAPIAPPVFNWTGFYFGGNFGGGWDSIDYTANTTGTLGGAPFAPSSATGTRNLSGVLGGGQLGFNWQFATHWVAGVEADIDATSLNGSDSGCDHTAGGAVGSCATATTRVDDFGTVRGRLGYAFDRVLVYGTGGWAWDNDRTTSATTCIGPGCPGTVLPFTGNPSPVSLSNSGWTAGAGVEWGFLPSWTFRAEYLHLQFAGIQSNSTFTGTVGGVPLLSTIHTQATANADILRFGVNYLFNWGAAPVAGY
jgi:outer membrane immunogenic protein